jgi:glycine/D-amino acid oxidase-like deaminating enzyme
MGNWTALNLREMGLSVALIDQYAPGNSKSSSMGEVRGMRLTYGEEEHEMLWARNACELWKMRGTEFGTDMFYQCGALAFRNQWTARTKAERALFDKHRIPYEVIPYDDLLRRWPQAPPPGEDFFGFYHPWGGVLSPRDANLAVSTAFQRKGGSLVLDKGAPGARAGGKLQTVTLTSGTTVSADTFVFALGAWLPKVFPEVMKGKLSVRKAAYYMYGTPPGDNRFSVPHLPNTGLGLPSINGAGFGLLIAPSEEVDPDSYERVPNADEKAAAREILAKQFPALKDQPMLAAWTCQTENSVDGQCFFDVHPEMDNVWLVGGGSWHAFKIGPVIGDYVAHRVVGEKKALPEAGLSGDELAAIFKLKAETFA